MHEAHEDSEPWADPLPPMQHRLVAVHALNPRVQQELTEQYESVLAFADFCAYLTAGRVGEGAGQLVQLAQALHFETTEDLLRGAGRG